MLPSEIATGSNSDLKGIPYILIGFISEVGMKEDGIIHTSFNFSHGEIHFQGKRLRISKDGRNFFLL